MREAHPDSIKKSLLNLSRQLGFCDCRVARAARSPRADEFFLWLRKGCHAGMEWIAREPERRANPEQVLPGCRSVVSLAYAYDCPRTRTEGEGSICLYAHGRDYHGILEEKLADLSETLSLLGGIQKGYVDSGPVLERDFAEACGLGWRGRNGLILRPVEGSRFFIAVLLTTLELEADPPISPHCGQCRRCTELCPTRAIGKDGLVDANKCLSYWTIEHRGVIPEEIRPLIGDRLYGCDTCIRVCPWNRKKLPQADERFLMSRRVASMPLRELLSMDSAAFAALFRHSPLKRLKWEGLLRNGCVVLGNIGSQNDIPLLKTLAQVSPLVQIHALWAIQNILSRQGEMGKIAGE